MTNSYPYERDLQSTDNCNSDDYKCFRFEVELSGKMRGYIYARDEEQARDLIERGQNDDIQDVYETKIENIIKIVEVKCDS